jgi:hypothetical protein
MVPTRRLTLRTDGRLNDGPSGRIPETVLHHDSGMPDERLSLEYHTRIRFSMGPVGQLRLKAALVLIRGYERHSVEREGIS